MARIQRNYEVFCASVPPIVFCAGADEAAGEISPISALNCLTNSLARSLLGFFFDLDLLLVDIAQGHFHAGFVDGGHFLDLADHLVVRLADAGDFELLHGVGDLLLPLGAAVVADGVERLLRLALLLDHEGLLDGQGLVEGGAGGLQLALVAGQGAPDLLQLDGETAGQVVAAGLDGGLHLGGEVGDSFLYLASSFSSRVALALTMAMLSFIRGTWSFMSRMFCSRMSSGFSPTEMKNPTNERTMRDRRLHINQAPFPRLLFGSCGTEPAQPRGRR